MKCLNCENNTFNKFCSRKCYNEYRIGKPLHSNEEKKRKSILLTKIHKNRTEDERNNINSKISESNKYKYSLNQVNCLKKLLEIKLLNRYELANRIGVSDKVLMRILFENNLNELYNYRIISIPKQILKLSETELYFFINELKTESYYYIVEKYKLSEKTMVRLYNFFKIEKLNKNETNPEKSVRIILENLGVEFKKEKYIDKTIRVDFIINNKIIEVQGDYYHANPILYKNKKLSKIQKENIANDIRKKDFFKNNHYELLEIWENDLKTNLKEVENKIKKYLI